MMRQRNVIRWVFGVLLAGLLAGSAAGTPIVFNDNGAWCWFQDERVIVHDGKLIVGSVAHSAGVGGSSRHGNVEVVTHDIAAGTSVRTVLHANLEADDHNNPAFLALPDGRVLAMYTRHLTDRLIRYRITTSPNDTTSWAPAVTLTRDASVTYSNVYRLSAENNGNGRIYDFYRGENFNPNYIYSDNNGQSWSYGGWLIRKDGHRPYPRYTSNNVDKIHFITTEAHPRDYDNSIYHGYIYQGGIYTSDGTRIHEMASGPVAPESLTKLYQGGPSNVAWTTSIRLDENGHPYVAFSAQITPDGSDLRYFYGRWDGAQWHVHEMAYAGTRLYAAESDYTGLVALDPRDPDIVYISADVHPVTGQPLISSADGQRHYEIFRGTTTDMGASWTWEYITRNSAWDNIRPIVPPWDGGTVLLWMRGTYTTYTNFNTQVVGLFDPQAFESDEPEIVVHPKPTTVRAGGSAQLSVTVESPLSMSYAWYRLVDGGSDVPVGGNSSTLTISPVAAGDRGAYYCVATNSAGSARSASARVMIADLHAHLPLDNSYADATGNGYNATAYGSPVFVAGKYGQAIAVDGDDHLVVPTSGNLTLQHGGTVSAWVKTGSLPTAWASIAAKGRWAWRLAQYGSTGRAAFHINSADFEFQANGSTVIVDDAWHHVVGTYDGQTVSLYVDGQLNAASPVSQPINVNADTVWIANRSDAARFWNGLIDDVRVYGFAMDADAVMALYNGVSCYAALKYDLTGDCKVGLPDMLLFMEQWLDSGLYRQE